MKFDNNSTLRKLYNGSKNIVFPIMLVAFAMLKINKGVDLTDVSYSLGNCRFFTQSSGVWFLLTFVSNLVGYVMTLLPFGNTMLGMRFYTLAVVAVMSVLGYRFFRTKMPAWLAFGGEAVAIGLCWTPSPILYNYLTYFFLFAGCMLLFRGLAGNRDKCLVAAGVCLGLNSLVRFPGNGLEVLLILALVFYAKLEKWDSKLILRRILLCIAGYVGGLVIDMILLSVFFGVRSVPNLFTGALGISSSASDYTFAQMLKSTFDAYLHGFMWALYMIVCALLGIPFFMLWSGKYIKLRKLVYSLCILFLFFVLGKWGMYNFKYYQKESALQWGAVFLLISIGIDVWMLFTKSINNDWRLLGAISLIVILITPLGSNNYIWPVLNNLFFIAPVSFWIVYRFARWGRTYIDITGKILFFPFKAMLLAAVLAFCVQAFGVGACYVFSDGENGEPRSFAVSDNPVLKGMKTNAVTAENLSTISKYFKENESSLMDKKLVLYGNIPGLCYYLDRPSALNTSWSDLNSNPVEEMQKALEKIDATDLKTRPVVILSKEAYDLPDNSIKFDMILKFIEDNSYSQTYTNDMFAVFE